jgi:xylulokinase
MDHLIGIDVGSSDCKVMILTRGGRIVASSRQPIAIQYPQLNWAEQDPEDWYRAACRATRLALEDGNIAPESVIGMSICGPAHNAALLGADDQPIYPVIHWSDLRSATQAGRLSQQHGERIFQITYCAVNPAWTLAQLMWLKENEVDAWSRLRRVLVTKDYVRYRFTGQYQTDIYDAIGTQLYDVAGGCWSDELCALLELDPAMLPSLAPAQTISGALLPDAAADCGLLAGIPVAVGSGDSVVEAFSIGATHPGACIVKIGTAANVNLVTSIPRPSRQSITYRHVVDDTWFTITATNSGASTMRWFRDTFCRLEVEQANREGISVYELIDRLADGAPPGANGLLFHPYLNGERTPYWNPHLRGDFVGISAQHNAHHFARAILEGVAFSLKDCLQVVQNLGEPLKKFYLVGGGAKSKLWRQVICDVLGVPLVKPSVEDAALGAALLAGVAVGVSCDWESDEETLYPDDATRQLYDDTFAVYRDIARDLAVHSRRLVQLSERHDAIHENPIT